METDFGMDPHQSNLLSHPHSAKSLLPTTHCDAAAVHDDLELARVPRTGGCGDLPNAQTTSIHLGPGRQPAANMMDDAAEADREDDNCFIDPRALTELREASKKLRQVKVVQ